LDDIDCEISNSDDDVDLVDIQLDEELAPAPAPEQYSRMGMQLLHVCKPTSIFSSLLSSMLQVTPTLWSVARVDRVRGLKCLIAVYSVKTEIGAIFLDFNIKRIK